MAKVLITGGAGFIGSHLAAACVERGDHVRVLDNLSTGKSAYLAPWQDRLTLIQGSVSDRKAVEQAIDGIEIVFHQAALPSVPHSVKFPLETHDQCVTGTLTLLDVARRAGVERFVYAASSSAYGDRESTVKRETDLPSVLSPYGAAKLAGELYCQAFASSYGMNTVCLRYFNIFGPRQDPASPYSAVIPLFMTAMLKGERPTIFGDGSQSRDFLFVENVVQANLLAAETDGIAGEVFNIGSGKSRTLLELVDQLNALLGTSIEPKFLDPRPGDILHSCSDISLARERLGFQPQIDFEKGLDKTLQYYRGNE
ncbi:Nucleoside-diphosphate-sugar epimerase [Planctomycetales bacterium 10988]|nr:Nucleoside-diphosphate-sugar epimerase [Planctomycetales bacterium 10988]